MGRGTCHACIMTQTLLVIDVQRGVVDGTYRRDEVVAHIDELVAAARRLQVPVVWVQHNEQQMPIGSEWWQIVPELDPADEPRVDKQYRSSFEHTPLADILGTLGTRELVVCGAETNYCVRHTIHAALERGFDVTLVADAHTTSEDDAARVIEEQNANFSDYRLSGRRCVTQPAAALFQQ